MSAFENPISRLPVGEGSLIYILPPGLEAAGHNVSLLWEQVYRSALNPLCPICIQPHTFVLH
jgi:hypothetical protein